jgi:hypothetical protein
MPPPDELDEPEDPPGGCGMPPPLDDGDGKETPPPDGLPDEPLEDVLPLCDIDEEEQPDTMVPATRTATRPANFDVSFTLPSRQP